MGQLPVKYTSLQTAEKVDFASSNMPSGSNADMDAPAINGNGDTKSAIFKTQVSTGKLAMFILKATLLFLISHSLIHVLPPKCM